MAAEKIEKKKHHVPEFNWQDPFLLDELLSEEERMIEKTAKDFAQQRLMPGILEANRHEEFDRATSCGKWADLVY